jgi:hydroxymethylbilane synthase
MNPSTLRIATRKSALALWQAEHVAALARGASGTGRWNWCR